MSRSDNPHVREMAMALAESQGFAVHIGEMGDLQVLIKQAGNAPATVDPEQFLKPARDLYAMLNAIGVLYLDEGES